MPFANILIFFIFHLLVDCQQIIDLPLPAYELTRMQSHRAIFEHWREERCKLKQFEDMYEILREHYIELMAHMNLLRQGDGLDLTRRQALKTMKDIVQKKIHQVSFSFFF